MATLITNGNHGDSLQGSPEKRVTVAPDGTLWVLIVVQGAPGVAKFFKSTNGGATWTYVASDISLLQSSAVPSFFIDGDGYAHVSWLTWNNSPQVVKYARGTPVAGGSWSWSYLTISPAAGRLGVDTDVIAFRNGTGWTAWVCYTVTATGDKVAQISISATGALAVAATAHGPTLGGDTYQIGSLEFAHTGDGWTPSASPHLFFVTAHQGSATGLRLHKSTYSAGTWTWQTPVVLDASADVVNTTMTSVFDGTYLMVAYAKNTSTIFVSEWDGTAAPTARNPPAAPGGTGAVLGLSLAHDPLTDDIYLAYYDATDGDIRWSKFTRGANTWSAWAIAVTRTASSDDGKVQLVRHPPRDSVDMVYGIGSGTSWQIYSQQLVALARTPTAPTLLLPASGALVDLAAGATFTWQYNPVSPGDTQQAWAFVRTYAGPTTEYWNATSQSWGGSIVWNTSALVNPASATFAAGKWTNGVTYTWSVRTRSSTGADSALATARTVVATSAPVVTVIAPSAIAYGESTPLVEWAYTGLDAQRDYRVKVFVEAAGIDPDVTTPVWDSGVVVSNIGRSARIGVALTEGVAYRAYVKATSVTAVASAWAYSSFVISINPPLGPLVELRDEINYDTNVPRVRIDVLGQSNLMTSFQAYGQELWSAETNIFFMAHQPDDTVLQLEKGIKIWGLSSGLMSIRTALGVPPDAPYGQPALTGPLDFPVIPGVVYTGMASFKAEATTRACRVSIRWYDADDGTGSLISTSVGSQVVSGTTSYEQAFITDTAPPTARLAVMVLEILGATAGGEVFYSSHHSFAPGRSLTWQSGGYADTQTLHVDRSLDGGVTWETVVDRLKTDFWQQAKTSDRLMPYVTDVKYRAFTVVDIGTSSALSSLSSLVSTLSVASDLWAIRDPSDDIGEMNAYVTGHKRGDDESSSVHRPAGREYPVVDTEGIHAATGSLEIFVPASQVDAAINVLRRTVPMIIQSPNGTVFRARLIRRDYDIKGQRHRLMTVAYVEVD